MLQNLSCRVTRWTVLLSLCAPLTVLQAQTPADSVDAAAAESLRPIEPADYDQWERLGAGVLSPDGRWLAYTVSRVDGDSELRIRYVDSDSVVVVESGSGPRFSSDGRWVAFGKDRNSMGLLDLESGEMEDLSNVATFTFSDDGRYLAMRRPTPDNGRRDSGDESRGRGRDLVIRDLPEGQDVNFGNVAEIAWKPDEPVLGMVIDAAGSTGNGVRLWDATAETLRTLHSSPARYTGLRWRSDHPDLTVFKEREVDGYEEPTQVVLTWKGIGTRRQRQYLLDPLETAGFPENTRVVSYRTPRWCGDGEILFVGLREWTPEPTEEEPGDEEARAKAADTTQADAVQAGTADRSQRRASRERPDPPGLEIWHSRDIDLIPAQRRASGREARDNHLAAWHVEEGRLVRLADDDLENVSVAADGKYAIGRDGAPYDVERMFGPVFQDIYLVDVQTGERELVKERVQSFQGMSPGGSYLLYFQEDHFWVYDVQGQEHVNITASVPARFVDDQDDRTVQQKRSFGTAGWTKDDRHILLYDRYDIWRVSPDGSGGENLTNAAADEIRHRLVRMAPDRNYVDLSEPQYVALAGEWTKKAGYALLRSGREPETLIFEDRRVSRLRKADDADVYSVVMEAYHESPNIFIAGPDLAEPRRITDTNSFQSDFAWGRAELVDYENEWGFRLQAALFYPADYEPGNQYPMIVYPYERRSGTLHSYNIPSERSAYNTAVWSAEGYFVLAPDIAYRPRNPGLSAMEALVPAVEAALATDMIDPDRVGLIGHSWGGYQTTFAVTQTDMFAAGVAGAPLTNLISMYLSMYWNTGGTDARIFEISQGRMEVPWWEDYGSYVANSPVHHIEQMNTPLLMAFGTEDGAVEFNQGVEFYNAARRAEKDFVLLIYEGENHSLRRRPNQIDYHRRILEWFGHYLKGEPAPDWITDPVPYSRQREKLQEGPAAGRRR